MLQYTNRKNMCLINHSCAHFDYEVKHATWREKYLFLWSHWLWVVSALVLKQHETIKKTGQLTAFLDLNIHELKVGLPSSLRNFIGLACTHNHREENLGKQCQSVSGHEIHSFLLISHLFLSSLSNSTFWTCFAIYFLSVVLAVGHTVFCVFKNHWPLLSSTVPVVQCSSIFRK